MALPQPDFARASASLAEAAHEVALCANMPAVVQGQGIVDAINALTGQIQQNHLETQQRMQETQQQIAGIHNRFDALSIEIRARDANCHARLSNNTLVRKGDQPLEPLSSIITGHPIVGFPASLDAVLRLTPNEANHILEHLGQDMGQATIARKRQKIKALCGLMAF